MKAKLSVVTVFFLLCLCCSLAAQNTKNAKEPDPTYKTAIGFKFYPSAVSLKTMIGTEMKSAFELLGYFRDGFRITGLYEFHGILNKEKNLKWYIGFGGHFGLGKRDDGDDAKAGVDGVVGLDYKFMRLPLNISLDWQPTLGVGDGSAFTNWGGLGVRFAF